MKARTQSTFAALAALALAAGVLGCARAENEGPTERAESAGYERGPHRGRWLEEGDFALELTIFERGVPPEFRAYPYREGQGIDPSGVEVEVTLRRLGGRVDEIGFAPRGDHLLGDREVYEPHSFDAEVRVREEGREHRFQFSSYENRVTLDSEQREVAGIELATAGPATIRERVVLNGRVTPNEDALAHVAARFPGVVRSVHKRLGDPVARGDLLAVIESNESLRNFELRAPLAGTVIAKHVVPGELASGDRVLFEIADLESVWVDLDVYRRDFGRLQVGQPVRIDAGDGAAPTPSTLAYLSPIGARSSQTLLARAVLPNPDRSWRPGLFVTAEVEVGVSPVPVSVAVEALQRVRDWDVVFLADGDVFEAQPIALGRSDGRQVEVTAGLAAGQRYAAAGSFILKAEAGKAGATHDH
ncbi:MAG: efflux RND transporter periplasmic adaptor subunit [Myxococcota bacterium]